jgi:uncharacterized membrane protein YcaP (DUF421 family)
VNGSQSLDAPWVWNPAMFAEVAMRTAVIYVVMLVGIRLAGKREIGQMTPFDLVVLLLISNAVQNAMVGPQASVTGGLVAAATLLIVNQIVVLARVRSGKFRRFVEGVPIVLVAHGEIQYRNLQREHMTTEELKAALRQHEVESCTKVELAMLEVDGSVTVIRRDPHDDSRMIHSRKRLTHHHKHPE